MTDPTTTRPVIREPLRDSTHWDHVIPRPDDIIIVSCYKSGTTLTQQIVNLLLHGTRDFRAMNAISPWVDSALHYPGPAAVEALPSPRFLKSHLPFGVLPYRPEWKYIYTGRDGRDVCLSLFDHCKELEKHFKVDREGRPLDHGPAEFSAFYDDWLDAGRPRWSFWTHVDSWWKARHLPNVLLLRFSELTAAKSATARRIAEFLGVPWSDTLDGLVGEHSSLDRMQQMELAGQFGGAGVKERATFINKGRNGRWRALLTDAQSQRYLDLAAERLEPACAAWLNDGGSP